MTAGVHHVFRAASQPATRFKIVLSVPGGTKTIIEQHPKHRLFCCGRCKKKRYAKNMTAQVYYDGTYFACKQGKGCRAPGHF